MSGHGALTWVLLGVSIGSLITAPAVYRQGVRDGAAKAAAVWRGRRSC